MAQDDAIRIDIEVSTQSAKEIQDILKEIRAGEERLQRIKLETTTERLRKRGTGGGGIPDIGGAPEDISQRVEIERGGIFGGGGKGLPAKGRDRTSKEPIQRENRFNALEEQVEEQRDTLSKALGIAGSATGLAGSLGSSGPIGFIDKIFKSPLGKAGLVAAIAITITKQIAEILQYPGNIFDRRYRRMIKDEGTGLLSRADQAQLRQGFRTIRVSTRPGLRGGQGQVFSNQEALRRGIPLYDLEFEAYSKGLYK